MHFLSPSASEAHFRLFSSQRFASIETADGLFSKCNVSLEINFLLSRVVWEMVFMCWKLMLAFTCLHKCSDV